jgi:cytochrome P450 family 150 subfamily A5
VTDFEATDFFRGSDLIADPYEYFDWLRAECPFHQGTHPNVMVVTGYDEAVAIYADTSTFSSCNSPRPHLGCTTTPSTDGRFTA